MPDSDEKLARDWEKQFKKTQQSEAALQAAAVTLESDASDLKTIESDLASVSAVGDSWYLGRVPGPEDIHETLVFTEMSEGTPIFEMITSEEADPA